MKKLIILIILAFNLQVMAQSFDNTYPYFVEGFGDAVFVNDTGYTLAGLGWTTEIKFLFLIHTDLNGDTLHTQRLDYGLSHTGILNAVTDQAGDHYLSFWYTDSIHLVKFSPDWNELWRKQVVKGLRCEKLFITSDGNLLMAGKVHNDITSFRAYFMLDPQGNILWLKRVPNPYGYETCSTIAESTDGNFLFFNLGYSAFGFLADGAYLRVLSPDGILTDSCYFRPDGKTQCIVGSSQPYGDHMISLMSDGNGNNFLLHHEGDGEIISQKKINLPGDKPQISSFVINDQGNLIACGSGMYDYDYKKVIIHSMTPQGDSLWTYVREHDHDVVLKDMKYCPDGGVVISTSHDLLGIYHPGLLKTDKWGGNSGLGVDENANKPLITVYPNPANEYVVFETQKSLAGSTLILSDITGRQVAQQVITSEKTVLPTAHLEAGVYLYQIENGQVISTGKVMVVK